MINRHYIVITRENTIHASLGHHCLDGWSHDQFLAYSADYVASCFDGLDGRVRVLNGPGSVGDKVTVRGYLAEVAS